MSRQLFRHSRAPLPSVAASLSSYPQSRTLLEPNVVYRHPGGSIEKAALELLSFLVEDLYSGPRAGGHQSLRRLLAEGMLLDRLVHNLALRLALPVGEISELVLVRSGGPGTLVAEHGVELNGGSPRPRELQRIRHRGDAAASNERH